MFACRCFQIVRFLAPPGSGYLQRRATRHRENCPRCRETAAADIALARRLRREARGDRREMPPFLAARIGHLLVAPPPRPAPRARFAPWAWAGLATIGLLTSLFLVRPRPGPPVATADLIELTRHQSLALTRTVESLPGNRILALAEADAMLQAELDALIADTRTAARFLAQVALPDNLRPGPR